MKKPEEKPAATQADDLRATKRELAKAKEAANQFSKWWQASNQRAEELRIELRRAQVTVTALADALGEALAQAELARNSASDDIPF